MRVETAFVGVEGALVPASFFALSVAVVVLVLGVGAALSVVVGVGGGVGSVVATLLATGVGVVEDVAPPLGVEPVPVPLPAFSPFVHEKRRKASERNGRACFIIARPA